MLYFISNLVIFNYILRFFLINLSYLFICIILFSKKWNYTKIKYLNLLIYKKILVLIIYFIIIIKIKLDFLNFLKSYYIFFYNNKFYIFIYNLIIFIYL